MGLRSDLRAACVTLLSGYATAQSIKLQVYPGRPRSINPPTAFVDTIVEATNAIGPTAFQRNPVARVVVLHSQFDSKDSADQADAFVDGFIPYAYGAVHAAGTNTVIGDFDIEDEPTYVPDWQPESEQRTYFATVISVKAFGGY